MMEKGAKIYVAGHRGMVGSAIVRELNRQGYTNIITRTHAELDLITEIYTLSLHDALPISRGLNMCFSQLQKSEES